MIVMWKSRRWKCVSAAADLRERARVAGGEEEGANRDRNTRVVRAHTQQRLPYVQTAHTRRAMRMKEKGAQRAAKMGKGCEERDRGDEKEGGTHGRQGCGSVASHGINVHE